LPTSPALRVLIADDEELGRERLIQLLKKQPDVEIAGIAANGLEALNLILQLRPQILFLDIRMPELDGFGVLREVDPELRPVTIFVTAYDQYAVQAFEAHGTDYLLKPYSDRRFETALERARSSVRTQNAEEQRTRLTHLLGPGVAEQQTDKYLERIVVKSGVRATLLEAGQIDWIQAEGVYVYLHAAGRAHLYRANLGQLERQLDPAQFVRVHRSAMVRIDRIGELRSNTLTREYSIVLKDGTEVPLSRSYRGQVKALLGPAR
jgi:two-component system LytT family response regulator